MYSCRFSPDGTILALGSRDNAIYIYQVIHIELLTEIGSVFEMAQNTFNINSRRLSVALGFVDTLQDIY